VDSVIRSSYRSATRFYRIAALTRNAAAIPGPFAIVLEFPFATHFGDEELKRVSQLLAIIALGVVFSVCVAPIRAAVSVPSTVIFDGNATHLSATSPFTQSSDLWVTLADLTRATGYKVKPQGVCRKELCFPIPSARKSEFLIKQGSVTWFNLSAFARLVKQPTAHDEALATWYFGPRPDTQNSFLSSLNAPNFILPDMNGKMHSLSDFRGKKVLLITWASW
jgi:hypothetical protein